MNNYNNKNNNKVTKDNVDDVFNAMIKNQQMRSARFEKKPQNTAIIKIIYYVIMLIIFLLIFLNKSKFFDLYNIN